jgi:tetratricopeptide (TPR) repeat protein
LILIVRFFIIEAIREYRRRIMKTGAFLTAFLLVSFTALVGCSTGKTETELAEVRKENETLKRKIESLEEENESLKRTGEYHYRLAVDEQEKGNLEKAKTEYEEVVNKYPDSGYVSEARKRLGEVEAKIARSEKVEEEKKREQEEKAKYEPRTPEIAKKEWDKFRNNESKYLGTKTTWRVKVSVVMGGFITGFIYGAGRDYDVKIVSPSSEFNYNDYASLSGEFPTIHQNDTIILTGNFVGVDPSGEIRLKPIKVVNEGYNK